MLATVLWLAVKLSDVRCGFSQNTPSRSGAVIITSPQPRLANAACKLEKGQF